MVLLSAQPRFPFHFLLLLVMLFCYSSTLFLCLVIERLAFSLDCFVLFFFHLIRFLFTIREQCFHFIHKTHYVLSSCVRSFSICFRWNVYVCCVAAYNLLACVSSSSSCIASVWISLLNSIVIILALLSIFFFRFSNFNPMTEPIVLKEALSFWPNNSQVVFVDFHKLFKHLFFRKIPVSNGKKTYEWGEGWSHSFGM